MGGRIMRSPLSDMGGTPPRRAARKGSAFSGENLIYSPTAVPSVKVSEDPTRSASSDESAL